MNKLVIVGGGSAGWLTALYAQKIYPKAEITLIESPEIGILGAGEGSTPTLPALLDFLEISLEEIVQNCQATIKTSIKFTNWTNTNGFFHHPFYSQSPGSHEVNFDIKSRYQESKIEFAHYAAAIKNHNLNDYSLLQKTANDFKVPYILNKKNKTLERHGEISLHFDARLFATFLKLKGLARGIFLKEGIVTKINQDADEYITSLEVANEKIECDFVFDCTGFKRLIIGELFQSKWHSHAEYLPAKKAVPFFLEMEEEIPPYTEAIAMKYGWMWKIPLQHRYGCGYVFDSDYISEIEAIEEIETFLGYEPIYPRKEKGAFTFSAGCYETIWVKNSLAIGLSAGFLEPLEATSIMQSIIVLTRFFGDKSNLMSKNDATKEQFNKRFKEETQEIVNFLYLHYITNKTNSAFWLEFTKKNKMPSDVSYILKIKDSKPIVGPLDLPENAIFAQMQYTYVLIGNELLSQKALSEVGQMILSGERIKEYEAIIERQAEIMPQFMKHKEFLAILKNNL